MVSYVSTSVSKPNINGLRFLRFVSWDQVGVVYYKWLKQTETNWWVWTEHWRKSRDITKWFCNMTMFGQMLQNGWKTTWKRLNGKSNSPTAIFTRYCPLRLSLVLIDSTWAGWAALCSLWRYQKMGQLMVSLKRLGIQMLPVRWEKVEASDGHVFC